MVKKLIGSEKYNMCYAQILFFVFIGMHIKNNWKRGSMLIRAFNSTAQFNVKIRKISKTEKPAETKADRKIATDSLF